MRTDYYERYRPKGFTYHADAYCYDCGVTLPAVDPEGNDRHAIMPWEELYSTDDEGMPAPYPCGNCGSEIV